MLSKKARRLTKKLSMIPPPPFFFIPHTRFIFWNAVILRLSYVKVTDKETYGGKLDKQLKQIIHSAITESLGSPLSPEKSPIILSLNKSLKCVYSTFLFMCFPIAYTVYRMSSVYQWMKSI